MTAAVAHAADDSLTRLPPEAQADVNALILPGVTTPGSLGNASSSSTYTSLSVHAQVGVHF